MPRTWLETLPSITSAEQLVEGGRYIFKGTGTTQAGNRVTFPCVIASNGVMHVARIGTNSNIVYFDETSDNFAAVDVTNAAGITASLAVQAPFLEWGNLLTIGTLPTKVKTLGVIIPTEEVSGLSLLNVIKDEPSDI